MALLICLRIVHTQADMGALEESVTWATLERMGRAGLARNKAGQVCRTLGIA